MGRGRSSQPNRDATEDVNAERAEPRMVLVVDGEDDVRSRIAGHLRYLGFEVVGTDAINAARAVVVGRHPSVIVVDRILPDGDGLDFCRELRGQERFSCAGIMIVSSSRSEEDRVAALEVGAEDYLVKPFSMRELAARVRVLADAMDTRRIARRRSSRVYRWRHMRVDVTRHEVSIEGEVALLRPLEFRLLCAFLESPGRVLTRSELASRGWPIQAPPTSSVVEKAIGRLRAALGGYANAIETVYGTGYRIPPD
jgi:DNA-binding response OmpR family regulator